MKKIAGKTEACRKNQVVYTITIGDIEDIAGRDLSCSEVERIRQALGRSNIGEVIGDIVFAATC